MNSVSAATVTSDIQHLSGWLPVDAVIQDGQPRIEWLDMRGVTLSEPFFHETVNRVRQQVGGGTFTDLDGLIQFEQLSTGLTPSGFVFHCSRSGSTVVTNALKNLDRSLVISEPYVVDKLIGRFFTDANETAKELLYSLLIRAAVNALGQRRAGDEENFFVKFAACSVLQVSRIRRIWPNVPILFLYRDPLEVIVSNLENPPEWLNIEGNPAMASALADRTLEEVSSMSREEFCARVVGRMYRAMGHQVNDRIMLLNYEQLSLATLQTVTEFFEAEVSTIETDAFAQVLRTYSKDVESNREFSSDSVAKQMNATRTVREFARVHAYGAYEVLEKKRKQVSTETR
jgi:hypothetical protein